MRPPGCAGNFFCPRRVFCPQGAWLSLSGGMIFPSRRRVFRRPGAVPGPSAGRRPAEQGRGAQAAGQGSVGSRGGDSGLAHEGGYCVVIVTHDPAIADAADVVYTVADGELSRMA